LESAVALPHPTNQLVVLQPPCNIFQTV
jgi:hypothetical protein